jgi:hypothetical protein
VKPRRWLIILTLFSALSVSPLRAFAVVAGQIDTFEDGTTQGWMTGTPNPNPPVNVTSGGPDGENDNYLRITAHGDFGAGGKLVAFNNAQWTGSYTSAGITHITLSVRNFSQNALALRLLFRSGAGMAISTNPIPVAANSGWAQVNFPVTAASLTALAGTASGALSGTSEVRLFHSPDSAAVGPEIAAQLGVDNIRAVGAATVSGTLTFEDIVSGALSQAVTFTFRPSTGNSFTRVVEVPASGVFSLGDVPPGNYTLHIKSAKHLAANVTVNAQSGNVSGLTATLVGGDANNDNGVDVLDLDQLIQTFDKCTGDAGFLMGADFNGDGCADVLDLDILIRNFDKEGSP